MQRVQGGLGGAVLTLIARILTESKQKKKLSYTLRYQRAFPNELQGYINDFQVHFREEILPDPCYLTVVVKNTSGRAIENPPIQVGARGATYVIPGWLEDVPDGYGDLWDIERADAELCQINVAHINPGQIIKAHFLLDELPTESPFLTCAQADLTLTKDDSLISDGIYIP